ncbi:MAG: cytochrome c, partial [Chloroflexi bacterium]|nr:cytochrome c [Chloroflexota bacterium]
MNERRVLLAALGILIFVCLAAIVFIAILFSASSPRLETLIFPRTPTLPALARGEKLYNDNCLVCHLGREGGTMMDYPPRHNANGHTWHHPDCELTYIILYGSNEMT